MTIRDLQGYTNEFAGREVTRSFRIESEGPLKGRFVWRIATGQRTLARGEREVAIPDATADVNVKFQLDSLRDEVVLPATLSVAVVVGEDEVARQELPLWFLSDNPFQARGEWLRSVDVQLFDPVRDTEKALQAASIPFTSINNAARIRAMQKGTLLIGAGISLRDHRSLAETSLAAAAQGTRVLWLSASEVSWPMEALESASQVALSDANVIRRLDKRLDRANWSGGRGLVASRLKPDALGGRVVWQTADDGWPWLEAHWPETGGQFIYCGFPVVPCWEDSPTPRYMLLRILERLNAEE